MKAIWYVRQSSIRHALYQKWFKKITVTDEKISNKGCFWMINKENSPKEWSLPTIPSINSIMQGNIESGKTISSSACSLMHSVINFYHDDLGWNPLASITWYNDMMQTQLFVVAKISCTLLTIWNCLYQDSKFRAFTSRLGALLCWATCCASSNIYALHSGCDVWHTSFVHLTVPNLW